MNKEKQMMNSIYNSTHTRRRLAKHPDAHPKPNNNEIPSTPLNNNPTFQDVHNYLTENKDEILNETHNAQFWMHIRNKYNRAY